MSDRVYIIAEAGVNHNGDLILARKLIDVASEAGADAVKFQSFKADKTISKDSKKADYQEKTTAQEETQYEMIKRLELSYEDHVELINHANQRNIKFLSTPFDPDSLELLTSLGMDTIKIASGEITNYPLLSKIGMLNQRVIISTGMARLGEIEAALDFLELSGTEKDNISVLHCNTEYPTPMIDVNLNAMITIRDAFNVRVGYSDHTLGIEVPIAAVAMGAKIIEKHFTLDREMEGPDHKASLEPEELKRMVTAIRNIEAALGDGIKQPSFSEQKNIEKVRKSIFINKNLLQDHVLGIDDISIKRPGDGISPVYFRSILGKKLIKDLKQDHKLSWNDFK